MRADPLAITAAASAGALLGAGMISLLVRRRRMTSRMRLHLNYPIPRRANLTVTFDAADESGPFAARATLLEGEGLALTRDSVDGLPDGEDRLEVFRSNGRSAPWRRQPLSNVGNDRDRGSFSRGPRTCQGRSLRSPRTGARCSDPQSLGAGCDERRPRPLRRGGDR